MSRDAKKPVSVNCPDDDAPLAKATDSGVVSPVGGDGDNEFVSKKQRSESSDRCVDNLSITGCAK